MFRWRPRTYQIDWKGWFRSALQPTTFLGLGVIALAWGGIEFYLHNERSRAEAAAIQSTTNLARVFEDQIVRIIKENDRVMRQLQMASVNSTLAAEFDRLAPQPDDVTDPAVRITLADAAGIVTHSNAGSVADRIDLSDREHFRVHREDSEAGLVISKPVMGRVSKKWAILLSRALRTPRGEFGGVVLATIHSNRLARLYDTVDLGQHGAVHLVGLDGVIRASAGLQVPTVGISMPNADLLRHAAQADEGSFTTRGVLDGIRRITSFRVVDGYPLIIAIGLAQSDVLATYWQRRDTARLLEAALTLFILIVIAVNIRHCRGLAAAQARQRESDEDAREKARELQLTLDHMGQGIVMIDANHDIALMNRQATRLLGMPDDVIASWPKYEDVLALQKQNGEFGPGSLVEPHVQAFIETGGATTELGVYERQRPNGTVLEVRSFPLPDGGFVRTFTDITERKRSADKIVHMAHHDVLTGLANRALLRSHIGRALARQRRLGEDFALLLIDLDHFKSVNDMLGHAAGDALLKQVAQRLQGCVRELDTVARVGGDEFAVLQAVTENRGSIETLARRIVEALSAPYTIDGSPAVIGASIGIARSQDSADSEQLFHNADLALYRVKVEGRNNFRLFEPEMDANARAGASSKPICAAHVTAASLKSTINRSSALRRGVSSASKRCCAGTIRYTAGSRPQPSCRLPRRSASWHRSTAGCSKRPAPKSPAGQATSGLRSICRR